MPRVQIHGRVPRQRQGQKIYVRPEIYPFCHKTAGRRNPRPSGICGARLPSGLYDGQDRFFEEYRVYYNTGVDAVWAKRWLYNFHGWEKNWERMATIPEPSSKQPWYTDKKIMPKTTILALTTRPLKTPICSTYRCRHTWKASAAILAAGLIHMSNIRY